MPNFRPFGLLHLQAIAGVTAFIVLLVVAGRRLRGTSAERALERSVAAAVITFWLGYVVWDLAAGKFDPRTSLPLELCDFVALIAAFSFAVHRRILQSLAYFWGLALSTQALFTPDLTGGPSTLGFWAFWLYHAFVVGAGVYAIAVRGFRPGTRDLRTAASLGVAYAAVMFAIDATFGVNYSYLGRSRPSQPTLIDALGEWPLRAGIIVALALAAMAALWFPWAFAETRRAQRRAPAADQPSPQC